MSRTIQPEGWPRPAGYSNGIAGSGELLFVAGQIGWNERGVFESDDFLPQVRQALTNVVAIVRAAGGTPESIVRMTWYVTDKHEYLRVSRELGSVYKKIIGPVYPAMTLVQVAALLEDRAKVEIEATALL